MNELKVFENKEFGAIHVTEIDGDPWFVARDVATVLGYKNARDAVARHVFKEDKGVVKCDTLGGEQDFSVINESGLYGLIMGSKLPKAREFKHWVTSEVLPSIRKHGLYATEDFLKLSISDPDYAISLLRQLKDANDRVKSLDTTVAVQSQQIAELQPKATYYDAVLSCTDALPISIIAKDYGWSAQRMNQFLKDQGVQYKLRETWLLYAKYAELGYTKSETYPYVNSEGTECVAINTNWTQKGRLFIYDLMKASGNLPLIEQEDEEAAG